MLVAAPRRTLPRSIGVWSQRMTLLAWPMTLLAWPMTLLAWPCRTSRTVRVSASAASRMRSGSASVLKARATCATALPSSWPSPTRPPRTCARGTRSTGLSQDSAPPCRRLAGTHPGRARLRMSTRASPISATCESWNCTGPTVMSLWALSRSFRPGPKTSLRLTMKVSVSPKRQGHSLAQAPAEGPSAPPPSAKSASSVSFFTLSNVTSKRGRWRDQKPGLASAGIDAATMRTESRKETFC
mmetsp:Transcript_18094/g.49953  ORF Transcript_18094/g.49953 Transcript_18094/m.49953 type:complete len:242 (+) Transcript_18094:321-1046(+)